jgi:uncharacterized membrane protein
MIYFIFESIFNRVTLGNIIEKRLRKKDGCFFGFASLWSLGMGGLSAVILNLFYMIPFKLHILLLMLIGGIVITVVELGFGMLLNILLKLDIWDYSNSTIHINGYDIPLHFKGQVDIYHSLIWIGMSYLIIKFINILQWLVG